MNGPTTPRGYAPARRAWTYLGATTERTGRRWLAELRARGLKCYVLAGRKLYRFAEIDKVMAQEVEI